MASIGRENVINGGAGGSPQSISPGVVTTSANDDTESTASATEKAVTTTARTVNIRITTGSGFLWNGRIPTGVVPGEDYPTTVVDDPPAPTPDPGYPGSGEYPGFEPPVTTPVDPNPSGEEPPVVEPPVDPNPSGEDPPVVDPPVVDPNPGPDVPPVVDNPVPPAVDPNPNGNEGGGSPEPSPDPMV